MRRVSQSSSLTDWHSCKRSRYWGYEFKGRGIQLALPNEDLQYGLAFHAGAELLVQGKSLDSAYTLSLVHLNILDDELITVDGLRRKDELAALLRAHLILFTRFYLTSLHSQYEVIDTEIELVHPLSNWLIYATRLDILARRVADKMVFNINYKTSASPGRLYKDNLYNLQLLMEADAARSKYGWVGGSIVVGVNKGAKQYEEDKPSFRRNSPLIYGYKKLSPIGETEYSPSYKYKWEKVPIWEVMSIDEWIERIPQGVLATQITENPAILHNPNLMQSVRRQIVSIEESVRIGINKVLAYPNEPLYLDCYFQQNFNNCNDHHGYGYPCPFRSICHDGHSPLSGDYKWRVPNHPIEDNVIQEMERKRNVRDTIPRRPNARLSRFESGGFFKVREQIEGAGIRGY